MNLKNFHITEEYQSCINFPVHKDGTVLISFSKARITLTLTLNIDIRTPKEKLPVKMVV